MTLNDSRGIQRDWDHDHESEIGNVTTHREMKNGVLMDDESGKSVFRGLMYVIMSNGSGINWRQVRTPGARGAIVKRRK